MLYLDIYLDVTNPALCNEKFIVLLAQARPAMINHHTRVRTRPISCPGMNKNLCPGGGGGGGGMLGDDLFRGGCRCKLMLNKWNSPTYHALC